MSKLTKQKNSFFAIKTNLIKVLWTIFYIKGTEITKENIKPIKPLKCLSTSPDFSLGILIDDLHERLS